MLHTLILRNHKNVEYHHDLSNILSQACIIKLLHALLTQYMIIYLLSKLCNTASCS